MGIGVSVGVAEGVGVSVGVDVSVGVGVAVSIKGKAAIAPTAPSSRTWLTMLRLSPGRAPSSSKVAAKELMINEGAAIPHNQIIRMRKTLMPIFALRLRLANQTEMLLLCR